MARRGQAFWARSSGFALLLVSACITPPPELVASNTRIEPPVSAAAVSPVTTSPRVSGIAVPASSVLDWKTPTPPGPCPAPPDTKDGIAEGGATHGDTIVATSATVDWAKIDAGAPVKPATVTNASRVVAAMRAGLRACYHHALAKDGLAAGTVVLTITVGCDGSVTAIHETTEHLAKETLACVADVARDAQFEPPTGGYAVIRVPVTFAPGH